MTAPVSSENIDQPDPDRSLTRRLITGFIAGPIVVLIVLLGGWIFGALILVAGVLAIGEFGTIIRQGKPPQTILWWLGGLIYIGGALIACTAIRLSPDGLTWIVVLLAANWGTDSLAYIAGKRFGQHPLAPTISPHKTIEGAIGGAIGGGLIALIVARLMSLSFGSAIWIAILVPIATVFGDLIESAFKRHFGVKNSGNLLPGHGGVLDRVDGLLLAVWVVGILLLIAR